MELVKPWKFLEDHPGHDQSGTAIGLPIRLEMVEKEGQWIGIYGTSTSTMMISGSVKGMPLDPPDPGA